jgi:hypothetical protein
MTNSLSLFALWTHVADVLWWVLIRHTPMLTSADLNPDLNPDLTIGEPRILTTAKTRCSKTILHILITLNLPAIVIATTINPPCFKAHKPT